MANRRKGLVIIPAYNEEACICQTVERVRQEAVQFDVVVIDDCSTDRTREICAEQGFPCIGLSANLGIGGAVQTGYRYARGKGYEMAVQFDADGQHDVACLPRMVRCMEEQRADLVVGSRFLEKEGFQSSAARRAGIRWFSWLIRFLTGVKITDPTSGLRLAGKEAIALFAESYPKDYPEPESVFALLRRGARVREVPVRMHARQGGSSSISPAKAVYYMVKVSLAILVECRRARRARACGDAAVNDKSGECERKKDGKEARG